MFTGIHISTLDIARTNLVQETLYNNVENLFRHLPVYIIKYVIHPQTIFNFNTSGDRLNVQTYFPAKFFQ